MGDLGRGALAGAVGTLALQVATYTDMLVRGRPASQMPAKAAAKMAGFVGVDLQGDDQATTNRREAVGTLFGYGAGVGVATACAAFVPGVLRRSVVAGGALLGAAAMAGADAPLVGFGLTDPRKWPASSWAADVVPHALYGVATVAAFQSFDRRSR